MTDSDKPPATEEEEVDLVYAATLGLSVDEMKAAKEAGLLGEKPSTTTAVAKALVEGKITEATADALLYPPTLRDEGQLLQIRSGPAPSFQDNLNLGEYLAKVPHAPAGVEYVIGIPRATPVLRALRQPIYDTVIVPEDGRVGIDAFADTKWYPDRTPKARLRDTNLSVDGSLGYPLEFDLKYVEIVFEKFSHPDDVKRVLRSTEFLWFFGQNTPWLRTTLSQFTPSFSYEYLDTDQAKVVEAALARFQADGVWTTYRHDMMTDGKPRRISSTEVFRARIEGDAGELHGPVRFKVKMQDTLYTRL